MENSNIEMEQPIMVIINCVTYNHASYIRDCLDGFVMQQTTFPFYAVVHDDASTDGTANIVREYAEKYPDIIKPIYETENQYSKHDGSLRRIMYEASKDAKYIAMCEGDDYWTDPLKLQKQVDFLEQHEDFVLSFHDVKIIDVDGNPIKEDRIRENMHRDWSEYDIMCGYTPPTPTLFFRSIYYKKCMDEFLRAKNIVNGDTIITSLLGRYGKGKYHTDISSSICRVHKGGVWQMTTDLYKRINSYKAFSFLATIHKDNTDVKQYIYNIRIALLRNIIRLYIEEGDVKDFLYYYLIIMKMLFTKFKFKTMYVTSKDFGYWWKIRQKM